MLFNWLVGLFACRKLLAEHSFVNRIRIISEKFEDGIGPISGCEGSRVLVQLGEIVFFFIALRILQAADIERVFVDLLCEKHRVKDEGNVK
jgi:hypothetical protein